MMLLQIFIYIMLVVNAINPLNYVIRMYLVKIVLLLIGSRQQTLAFH
jgi:hypothetical protein